MNDKTKRAAVELESPFLDGEILAGRPRPEAGGEPADPEAAAAEAFREEEDEGGFEGDELEAAEPADSSEAEVSEECED